MSVTPDSSPPGIIIVSQDVLGTVGERDILSALPQHYLSSPRIIVRLDRVKTSLAEINEFHWAGARRKLRAEFREKLEPLLLEHPDYRVQYFGMAPIPCIMDLGYLLGGQLPIDVYQQRHDTKAWVWDTPNTGQPLQFVD